MAMRLLVGLRPREAGRNQTVGRRPLKEGPRGFIRHPWDPWCWARPEELPVEGEQGTSVRKGSRPAL